MNKEPQVSSVKPYLEWEEGQPASPQFGILSELTGTWVNWKDGPKGLHTTCMPSPGTSSETIFGVFHFKSQEYTEELKFTQVNEPVRNRGGSNEQFNAALKYETAIIDNDNTLQHFENGMYLWLGDNQMPWQADGPYQNPPTMFKHTSTDDSVRDDDGEPVIHPGELGPQFVPPHSISRSGVIPHGTTIHITGNITETQHIKEPFTEMKPPHIADLWEQQYLAISPTMGINPERDLIPGSLEKPDWTYVPREDLVDSDMQPPAHRGVNSARAYFQRIFNYNDFGAKFPYTVQPNLKLSEANEGLKFRKYAKIELDSQHETGVQGGTINNVMIHRYCRVARMRHRMWLEEIELDEKDDNGENKVIQQLQYEQIVDFEFMFGASGETTLWPHIQVNTLRRLEDIPEDKRLPPIKVDEQSDKKPVLKSSSQYNKMNHSKD